MMKLRTTERSGSDWGVLLYRRPFFVSSTTARVAVTVAKDHRVLNLRYFGRQTDIWFQPAAVTAALARRVAEVEANPPEIPRLRHK